MKFFSRKSEVVGVVFRLSLFIVLKFPYQRFVERLNRFFQEILQHVALPP